MESFVEILALTNDVLQAVIVIFGTAVVLYNIGRIGRSSIMRAFCALITFVVLVYLSELLVSRIVNTDSAETWLRLGWIGITLVPAAQYHLSDALLTTTGGVSIQRKVFVRLGYGIGIIFLIMVYTTDWIVSDLVPNVHAPHLQAGLFFSIFTLYFWLGTAVSIYHVWSARQHTITTTTRQRMTITLFAFLAAPLAVYPYLTLVGSTSTAPPSIFFWLIVITGNIIVGTMFALLTSHLIYFAAESPDRVVRVRLFKFMARVPLAGTIVLVVYIIVNRNSPILGLPADTALGFAMVVTVMLVEWAIHAYKRPLERFFQLNDDPDIRRIQRLSERLLTTRDLQQFLESVLAATCEALRTPTAFVAALTEDGPKLEAIIGPLIEPSEILQSADLRQLAHKPEPNGNGDDSDPQLRTVGDFIVWQNYWIQPLYNQKRDLMLGIFGVRARADEPDLTEKETVILIRLVHQAEMALEDRILQQEVFAAVEGLLPEITALQEKRSAATFDALPTLTAVPLDDPDALGLNEEDMLVDNPEFNSMIKDALTHYWGGPKLTKSPLMRLQVVEKAIEQHGTPQNALRAILTDAIELQKPEGERNLSTTEWILYNILEMKFVQGKRVRDVARRLAMSESDLYRKQRVALENVARTVAEMEKSALDE